MLNKLKALAISAVVLIMLGIYFFFVFKVVGHAGKFAEDVKKVRTHTVK